MYELELTNTKAYRLLLLLILSVNLANVQLTPFPPQRDRDTQNGDPKISRFL